MDRKDFLSWLGIGSAIFGGNYFLNKKDINNQISLCSSTDDINTIPAPISLSVEGRPGYNLKPNPYGGMVHAPLYIKEDYGGRFYFSPEYKSDYIENINTVITAYSLNLGIAHSISTEAWTFNGTTPGPILRYREGTNLRIKFQNKTNEVHSLHFHGNHDPKEDGWDGIPSYGEYEYCITCDPPGIHPYHCHVPPIAKHIAKGLYGAMIVDPVIPRKKAHEFVLIFSGWDLKNRGINDIYSWNGIAGYYERFPIKVPIGQLVRLYIINLSEYDPIMTFHLHGKIFDVYRSSSTKVPDFQSDVVSLGPTERAILEFTLEKKGRYMFHPHQSRMAERGAMGWIVGV